MEELTKKQAYELIDEEISKILMRTPTKYWHSILNHLIITLSEENRCFIQVGIDEDILKKFLSNE